MTAELPDDSPLPALLEWAKQKGIKLDPRLRPGGPIGRSLVASEAIEPGTTFLMVPRDVLLHADHSLNDKDYRSAFRELSRRLSSSASRGGDRRSKERKGGGSGKKKRKGIAEVEGDEEGEANGDDGESDADGAGGGGPLDDRDRLCLLLMIERSRGDSSEWAPYIDSLPKAYDDPLWWDDDDDEQQRRQQQPSPSSSFPKRRSGSLSLLAGSRAGAAAEAASRSLERVSALRRWLVEIRGEELRDGGEVNDVDKNPLAALSGADADADARWARSTVWSRAFNLPPRGSKRVTLLPVGDMLDHSPAAHVRWSAGGGGGGVGVGETAAAARAGEGDFVFETLGGVPKNDPIYSNYGNKSNEELLVGYGFVLSPKNDADFFHFSLGVGGGGDAGLLRRRRLARLGVPVDAYCSLRDPLPKSAVVAACAALAGGAAGQVLDEVPCFGSGAEEGEKGTATTPSATAAVPCIEVRPPPCIPPPPSPSTSDDDVGIPVPPETQLRALAALRGALRARARELGRGWRGDDGDADDGELSRRATSSGDHHAAAALTYRAGQRRLAAAAELALSEAAGRATRAAASSTAAAFGFGKESVEKGERNDLLVEVGLGCDSSVPPSPCAAPAEACWTWGVRLPRGAERGQSLARVPPSPALALSSDDAGGGSGDPREGLAVALLCASARAGLFSEGGEGGRPNDDDDEGSKFVRRLARAVPLPAAVRLSSSSPTTRRCAELLEGTPAHEALVDEAEGLLEEGKAAASRAREVLLKGEDAKRGPLPSDEAASARAGCWALAVVDRAAIPGPSPGLLVLSPLAAAVPKCFRGVAVDFEWEKSDSSSYSLVIRAATDLPAGIELRRGVSLVGESASEALVSAGPEALAALLSSPSSVPEGHGGKALWHSFQDLQGTTTARFQELCTTEQTGKKKKKKKRKKGGESDDDSDDDGDPFAAVAALARRAASAAGILQGHVEESLFVLGRPTPRKVLAAEALALLALPDGGGGDARASARRALSFLKEAGVKGLVRSRKAAEAAAKAAEASKGAGRDDAAVAAAEAERAADDFLSKLSASSFGERARASVRRALEAAARELREKERGDGDDDDDDAAIAGARLYRRGLLETLEGHARSLEGER